jgi:nitrite reductase/ring-hydroxylating ferredoxin subunit
VDAARLKKGSMIAFPTNSRYPTGWFQVGWSDELACGEVREVQYFGKQLVFWRGESGELYALDAYCLHNGANLGVRGSVAGEDIRCPWHGWQWDGDGRNTLIPYGDQGCKPNLKIQSWAIRDYYGAIMIWHDLAGREPIWVLPAWAELDSEDFYEPAPDVRYQWRIKAHVQNPAENTVDFVHVKYVHGAGDPPLCREMRYEGHTYSAKTELTYGAGKKSTWMTPNGASTALLDQGLVGLGLAYQRWRAPLTPALLLVTTTPVDDTYCDLFVMMTTERADGEDRPLGLRRAMIDHQRRAVEQDFFTWENMRVLDKPNLTPEETKTWGLFRRWASQFYPETDPRLRDEEVETVVLHMPI